VLTPVWMGHDARVRNRYGACLDGLDHTPVNGKWVREKGNKRSGTLKRTDR